MKAKTMSNKQSRREFFRLSAAGLLGWGLSQQGCKRSAGPISASDAAVLGGSDSSVHASTPKRIELGVQLYTIRDAMAADVPGSLKRVADTGYAFVELAGYENGKFYGLAPAELSRMVSDLGMEIRSSHTQVEAEGITLDNARQMAEAHTSLGVSYCVQPWVVEEARQTLDRYRKMAADWNTMGEIMKGYGIRFGYHNHNFEFDTVEGKIPYYDVLLPDLDPGLVTMELDLFWAAKAGQNPLEMFEKHPGRFELFHLKDMYTNEAPSFTPSSDDFAPVGEGVLPFKEILGAGETAGLKQMIVEQDTTKDGDPFAAIETSYRNLTTDILV